MSNEKKIFQLFADILKVDISTLNDKSSPDTIQNWDSIAVVNLVTELEQAFNVEFDILEIADFRNVEIIKSILEEKGVNF